MKIALCFWGITRSLKYTYPSIKKFIFDDLASHSIQYDIFIHTYNVHTTYNNRRAGEHFIILDNDEWKLINPTEILVDDQENLDIDFQSYRSQGDPWHSGFQTFDNHIRALWSLYRVSTLWQKQSAGTYDYVIYLRPDVMYYKSLFSVIPSSAALKNEIILPNFHLYPINDRFCIAPPAIAKIYGERFLSALEFSKKNQLHSEKYLFWTLQQNNIRITQIHFPFHRVRADGREIDGDVK